jgi:hypothetical protein
MGMAPGERPMTAQPTPTRTQRLTERALRTLGPHFGHPRGVLGYIAANVMARSNVETNRIVVMMLTRLLGHGFMADRGLRGLGAICQRTRLV